MTTTTTTTDTDTDTANYAPNSLRRGNGPVDLDDDSFNDDSSTNISIDEESRKSLKTTSSSGPIDMDMIHDQDEEFSVIWKEHEHGDDEDEHLVCKSNSASKFEVDDDVDNIILTSTNPLIETEAASASAQL